jgi:hypothetical protein
MGAASTVLQQCAIELADIGSQLAACVDCPMPPAVSGDVNALIAAVDVVLDRVGAHLINEAIGLVGRGIIAALDSLAAASGVTLSGVGVIGGNSGPGLTITSGDGTASSLLPGVAVIGGNTGPGFTILNGEGLPVSSILPTVGVIGGNSGTAMTITNIDGSPATLLESGVIGGNIGLGMTITPGVGSVGDSVGSSLGQIGGYPSPYPAFTFTPGPPLGAGAMDLRGIQFVEPLPNMPAPRGFVPRSGDIANTMAINAALGTYTSMAQADIRYGNYAIGQNLMGFTPQDREDRH